ncbi:hypothetical protein CPJCM30710_19110 [Clostridium polyendosporum]|uniref:Uncharacterized protein n=1 Tax=Clostridium polyendosporum TaxID=69208 RepID=A0A919S154_9CLOT|nr:hypothetical protein [Clostridium polyendosporum]GIM29245.1 hypothetical protein CPJCM30710_19110 [Clostridium polyendosporum]
MWFINERNEREFFGGKNDWSGAVKEAKNCLFFKIDNEEEIVDDELISCYNCRFRRWTEKSFVCCQSVKMQ